jgi:phage shock protein A
MTTLIIILTVLVVLVVIGATQREKLLMLFRSSTNDLIDKGTNHLSVIKTRIADAKKQLGKAIDKACDLKATENAQIKQLESLTSKVTNLYAEAKTAKENGENDKAKAKIELAVNIENQIEMLGKNIEAIKNNRTRLESKIEKVKCDITKYNIQLDGLSARKETNDALKKVSCEMFNGETLSENLDSYEDIVSRSEDKLDHKLSITEEDSVSFDSDIENKFNEL